MLWRFPLLFGASMCWRRVERSQQEFYRRFSDQSNLYVGMKLLCSAHTIVCRNRFSSSEGESRKLFLENVVNVHQSLNRVIRNACREVLALNRWFLVFYKCWRSLWLLMTRVGGRRRWIMQSFIVSRDEQRNSSTIPRGSVDFSRCAYCRFLLCCHICESEIHVTYENFDQVLARNDRNFES